MSNTIADKLCRDWFNGRAYDELSKEHIIQFNKFMNISN